MTYNSWHTVGMKRSKDPSPLAPLLRYCSSIVGRKKFTMRKIHVVASIMPCRLVVMSRAVRVQIRWMDRPFGSKSIKHLQTCNGRVGCFDFGRTYFNGSAYYDRKREQSNFEYLQRKPHNQRRRLRRVFCKLSLDEGSIVRSMSLMLV